MMVRLFSRDAVAKSPCTCGSLPGIYNIAFLADLMGHESIETTRIYLRKTSTEQQAIVDEVIDW